MEKKLILITCVLVSVTAIAAPAAGAISDGLVAYFKLDEMEGTTATDSSGNGNDGTLLGAGVTWEAGRDAGALMLTGVDTDGRLEFPTDGMSTARGTVAMWAYLTDPQPETNGRYLFGHTSVETGRSFADRIQIYMQEGTTASRLLDIGLGDSHALRTDIVELSMEEWLHVALTWDGGAYVVYLGGEEVANGSYTGLTTFKSIANIGNDGCGDPYEAFGGLIDEARVYNRALTADEVTTVFRLPPISQFLAQSPNPEDQAVDVPIETALAWTASEYAGAHDVYFGTVFDDVNDASRADARGVLLSEAQTATTYDPDGLLAYGQTYYWRIDEVNATPDNTVFEGQVWSFTTEPFSYAIEGVIASDSVSGTDGDAQKTVDGSGLNENDEHSVEATDMWLAVPGADPLSIQFEFDRAYKLHQMLVWNYNVQFELVLGFGLKDVTIEYSVDGADWMVLGDAVFNQATAAANYAANTTVDLGGVMGKFVRLTVNSGFGMMGQFGLSEVRFFQIPTFAREPQPADGATGVNPNTLLAWRAGREAVSHDVSLGTDQEALGVVDTVADSSYDPGPLDLGQTYYWQIDEVNEAAVPAMWEGDVWSFSTQEYFIVDDFESYDDEENRIYDAWLDGFVNDTGATVGYFEAPFAEQTIVNSGGQSMPLEYANDAAPFYSEAEFDLGSADWAANGADTLKLYVYGEAPAFLETAEGDIFMNAIGTDIWGTADEFRYAYKTLTGDGSITARVDALDGTPHGWVKGGVMIRQGTEGGAINAFTALTGGSGDGATFQWRDTADAASSSSRTLTGIAPPYYVRVVREGNTFTGYLSADGENWEQQGDSSIDVAMTDPVLIGLALTSHNAAQATSAAFSAISTTGNVTGQWTTADIGVVQPTGGNTPEDLYVAVEDTSGNVAVATKPDGSARPGWTEWVIPFGDLAGVNLGRVAMMYVGVGDRDNPSAGGTGLIFVDDILVGHEAATE